MLALATGRKGSRTKDGGTLTSIVSYASVVDTPRSSVAKLATENLRSLVILSVIPFRALLTHSANIVEFLI